MSLRNVLVGLSVSELVQRGIEFAKRHTSPLHPHAARVLALVFSIVVAGVYLGVNRDVLGPHIHPDEGAFLAYAATIAGYQLDLASSYRPGYPLLISPAFLLASEPGRIWALVQVTNAALWGVTFYVLILIARIILPEARGIARWGPLVLAATYPAWVSMSGYAMSENAFVLLFVLSVYLLARIARGDRGSWVLLGLTLGGLWWIHAKSLPVIFAAAITCIWVVVVRRERALLPLVGAGVALLLIVCERAIVTPHLVGHMTQGSSPPNMHYPSVEYVLAVLAAPQLWLELLVRVAGQVAYFSIGTAGLAAFGVIASLERLVSRVPYGRQFPSPDAALHLYLLVSIAGTIALSGMLFTALEVSRLDHWIYGRYVEAVGLPTILLGAATVRRSSALVILAVSGIAAWTLMLGMGPVSGHMALNTPALWPAFVASFHPIVWWAVGSCVTLAMAHALVGMRTVLVAAVFLYGAHGQVSWHTMHSDRSRAGAALALEVRSRWPVATCVGFDIDGADSSGVLWPMWQFGYHLFDYQISRVTPTEWYSGCDGPLISTARDVYLVADAWPIAYDPSVDMLLWSRGMTGWTLGPDTFVSVEPTSIPLQLILSDGWHAVETAFVWSSDRADLDIPLDPLCADFTCTLAFTFEAYGASLNRPVDVSVLLMDGDLILVQVGATLTSPASTSLQVPVVPASLDGRHRVRVRFLVPDAVSPEALERSSDSRVLGAALREVRLSLAVHGSGGP